MKKNILRLLSLALIYFMTMTFSACRTTHIDVTPATPDDIILLDQDKPLGKWISCTACDGKGHCSRCGGTGKVNGKKCTSCDNGLCSVCKGQGGHRK